MRKLWALSLILCLALFACNLETDEENLEAEFEIIYITQNYSDYFGEWGSVEIEYTITNTGSLNIDFYYIFFEIVCEDGSIYSDYSSGWDVPAGYTFYSHAFVSVGNKEALSAKITGSELTHYDW